MEPNAFRTLLLAELDSVHRLAYHLAPSPHEADDLVQETYLRAFRSANTFHLTDAGPRPWLFKILHNTFRTRMGREARQPGEAEGLEERIIATEPPTPELDWEQVDERLKRAIDALPAAYRTVLLLWAVEGMKYREIADVTEVALGTVMSRLYRARQILMQQVADLASEQRLTPLPEDAGAPMQSPTTGGAVQ